jgi:hypothetical protein
MRTLKTQAAPPEDAPQAAAPAAAPLRLTKAAPVPPKLEKPARAPAVAVKAAEPDRGDKAIVDAKSEMTGKKAPKASLKLVRDSFAMPKADFALIAALKSRALAVRHEAKKSDLLRAGLHALLALDDEALLATLEKLEPVKAGRPKQGR